MKNCISRFCLLALLLLMTIAPVRAEIIGQTTENEYIHRLIADNGLVYQFTVKNDKIASCGTWSCPEFFEAFEAACE